MHAGNVQLQNSSRLEFSDILAAMGLADAILNAVDFALGGKPRVDRDCDPVSGSFQVLGKCGDYTVHKQTINLLFSSPQPHAMHQINLADAIWTSHWAVLIEIVIQIPGGQLSGSFQVSVETTQCISRLSTCCLAHPNPMLCTRLTCVRSTAFAIIDTNCTVTTLPTPVRDPSFPQLVWCLAPCMKDYPMAGVDS